LTAAERALAAGALADVERQAAEVEVRLTVLESTIDAEYQEVLDRLLELGDERLRSLGRAHRVSSAAIAE
jgi:hypothetical protein